MSGRLRIVRVGSDATIQDAGRYGYLRYGIVASGPMDWIAYRLANHALNNQSERAAIEISFGGIEVACEGEPLRVAYAGGAFEWDRSGDDRHRSGAGGERLPSAAVIGLQPGDRLRARPGRAGLWSYLAIEGGIDVPLVLGSRSTYARFAIGGFAGRALQAGDILASAPLPTVTSGAPPIVTSGASPTVTSGASPIVTSGASPIVTSGASPIVTPSAGARSAPKSRGSDNLATGSIVSPLLERRNDPIRVILGPQDDYFTDAALATFFSSEYTVSPRFDRMGYWLEGPRLAHAHGFDIVSDGIPLGAIQVPGEGRPLVLMADHQATGGYPKLGTVIRADIPRLAQTRPGEKLRFERCDVARAQQIYCALCDDLEEPLELGPLRRELTPAALLSHNLIGGVADTLE